MLFFCMHCIAANPMKSSLSDFWISEFSKSTAKQSSTIAVGNTRHDSSFCEKLDTESVTKCVIIVGVQFWVANKLWKLGRYTFTLKECEFSYETVYWKYLREASIPFTLFINTKSLRKWTYFLLYDISNLTAYIRFMQQCIHFFLKQSL